MGGIGVSESGANIIFIEKRKSSSASLGNACAFPDLSVGLTMLFSRRWMLCTGNGVQDRHLNCYHFAAATELLYWRI